MAVRPARRRFTVDEYDRMVATGILGKYDRVELIDGEIVEKIMIGPPHAYTVRRLQSAFERALGDRAVVSVQSPVRVGDLHQPEPDVALLRPPADAYRIRHPTVSDVLLVVEVAESSLAFDRDQKVPPYGAGCIAECWLWDLIAGSVSVYRDPQRDGYGSCSVVGPGGVLSPLAFPDVVLRC